MTKLKICGNCKIEKKASEFHKNCESKDKLTSQCKVCRSAKKKIYCANNQERIAAVNKIWYFENREAQLIKKRKYFADNRSDILARQKPYMTAWRRENRLYLNEYDKNYRKENKDSYDSYIKPYLRQWQKDNKDIVNAKGAEHRANKINASPSWRNKETIKGFYKKAQGLTKETGVLHHVDHIVPLKGINVCGLHCEANLEVLTSTENLSKGNKFN